MKPSKKKSSTKYRQTKSPPSIDPHLQQSPPIPDETLPSTSQSRSTDLACLSDAFSSLSVDQIESTCDEAGCNLQTEDEEREKEKEKEKANEHHLPSPNAGSTASEVKRGQPQHVVVSSVIGEGYMAQQNWDSMKMFFKRAAMEFSRGNYSHAALLVEKGNYYRRLARLEDEKASLEIFSARNRAINNTVTIDLHGLHVKQAVNMLKRHLMSFACVPSVGYLKVIIGCGENCVGEGNMKRSVKNLATRENIVLSEENSGTILLKIEGRKEYTFTESDIDVE